MEHGNNAFSIPDFHNELNPRQILHIFKKIMWNTILALLKGSYPTEHARYSEAKGLAWLAGIQSQQSKVR